MDAADRAITGDQGLLAQVNGRDVDTVVDWIDAQTPEFRAGITHVAIDMSATYAKAVRQALPPARIVVDHFDLVKLANQMIDDVRRRTTQALRGRRGRSCDPEWTSRRRLLRGAERLTDEQRAAVHGVAGAARRAAPPPHPGRAHADPAPRRLGRALAHRRLPPLRLARPRRAGSTRKPAPRSDQTPRHPDPTGRHPPPGPAAAAHSPRSRTTHRRHRHTLDPGRSHTDPHQPRRGRCRRRCSCCSSSTAPRTTDRLPSPTSSPAKAGAPPANH